MPKQGNTQIERDVFDKLDNANGNEVVYPATLRTMFAVRTAVYRFNKEYNRAFRCTMLDDSIRISERPKESGYEAALREIKAVFKAAMDSKMDAEDLTDKVVEVIREHLAADEEPQPTAAKAASIRRQGRRR